MTLIKTIKELHRETKESYDTLLKMFNNDYRYVLSLQYHQELLELSRRLELLDLFGTDTELEQKHCKPLLASLLLNDRTGEATRRLIKEYLGDYLKVEVTLK